MQGGLRALHHFSALAAPSHHHGPAFVVIAMGLNTTEILVLSQVVLELRHRPRSHSAADPDR